ncbi:uncharacterized protein TNCV_4275611 [Trichonephila clavipes]|nr:uncharacterized protein TNCV_4275611 [Trichonephila clavipes]
MFIAYWLEHRTLDWKAWVRYPMLPNALRVHTEHVLVKSADPKSCGLSHERKDWRIFPSPSVQCRNHGGRDRWCRHLSSLRRISTSLILLSHVWCSRPTTGVLLTSCHDEFRMP